MPVGRGVDVPHDRRVAGVLVDTNADDHLSAKEHMDAVFRGPRRVAPFPGRSPVVDTPVPPFRRVCALRVVDAAGASGVATGWLAGPRTVITAARFLLGAGGWARSVEVVPA